MPIEITVLSTTGALVGGTVVAYLGGWDVSLQWLLILIALDVFTGCLTALWKGTSTHSKTGFFSSNSFTRGIAKKIGILTLIALSYGLDVCLNLDYLRDITVVFFILNEGVSIIENGECMGLPVPKPLRMVLDIYHAKIEN